MHRMSVNFTCQSLMSHITYLAPFCESTPFSRVIIINSAHSTFEMSSLCRNLCGLSIIGKVGWPSGQRQVCIIVEALLSLLSKRELSDLEHARESPYLGPSNAAEAEPCCMAGV